MAHGVDAAALSPPIREGTKLKDVAALVASIELIVCTMAMRQRDRDQDTSATWAERFRAHALRPAAGCSRRLDAEDLCRPYAP